MLQAYAAKQIAEEIIKNEGWQGVRVKATRHKRTYFRPDVCNKGTGLVVYGAKLMHEFTEGHGTFQVMQELHKAGYTQAYPFRWCKASAGVLIVLHELAHVSVHRAGLRVCGSMHGRAFFVALGRLIRIYMDNMIPRFVELTGDPRLYGDIMDKARTRHQRLNAALVEAYPPINPYFSGEFKKDDLVCFTIQGARKIGRIMRKGKKRWTVKVPEEDRMKYYIPEKSMRLCENLLDKS